MLNTQPLIFTYIKRSYYTKNQFSNLLTMEDWYNNIVSINETYTNDASELNTIRLFLLYHLLYNCHIMETYCPKNYCVIIKNGKVFVKKIKKFIKTDMQKIDAKPFYEDNVIIVYPLREDLRVDYQQATFFDIEKVREIINTKTKKEKQTIKREDIFEF